jgi:hypothetical protein
VFGLFLIALKTVHVGVFPRRTVKKNMRPEFSTAIAAMYNGVGISGAKKKTRTFPSASTLFSMAHKL